MKELLKYLVTNIVNHPDDVSINQKDGSAGEITLEMKVNPEDVGLVIGKGGKIIRSLRNILKAKAIIDNKKLNLVLIEE